MGVYVDGFVDGVLEGMLVAGCCQPLACGGDNAGPLQWWQHSKLE